MSSNYGQHRPPVTKDWPTANPSETNANRIDATGDDFCEEADFSGIVPVRGRVFVPTPSRERAVRGAKGVNHETTHPCMLQELAQAQASRCNAPVAERV